MQGRVTLTVDGASLYSSHPPMPKRSRNGTGSMWWRTSTPLPVTLYPQ